MNALLVLIRLLMSIYINNPNADLSCTTLIEACSTDSECETVSLICPTEEEE